MLFVVFNCRLQLRTFDLVQCWSHELNPPIGSGPDEVRLEKRSTAGLVSSTGQAIDSHELIELFSLNELDAHHVAFGTSATERVN